MAKNRLLAILKELRLPLSLITWVSSFLQNRQLRLAFDGQIEDFTSINTGIPQGSPISPILFLIYIRDLARAPAIKNWSYLDDFSITTASTSTKKNIRILELKVAKLYKLGSEKQIEFDLDKTELIYFTGIKA